VDRNEDPVAPWDTPEFKAKRGTNTEDENKRQEVEKLFEELSKQYTMAAKDIVTQAIKQAVSVPEPKLKGKKADQIIVDEVLDWDDPTKDIRAAKKQMEAEAAGKIIPRYESHVMDGMRVLTHAKERCQGRNCVIHNPSDHHMRGWEKRFHQPSQQTIRVCKHGLGHPDPDDVAYWQQIAHRRISTKHECDGCCTPKN
jgi:hypothetical protein